MISRSLQSSESARLEPIVYVVDDDRALREVLASLFRSVGLRVRLFESAQQLLQSELADVPSCVIADIRMPGLGGLGLQQELARSDKTIPVIFLTGFGDVPLSVTAMKGGAVDFLTKPFRDQELLDAVAVALERDRKRRELDRLNADLRARFESLTAREKQVMALATEGLMNKQTAAEMGLSELTVKIHRSNVMKKMRASSLADLVKMAEKLAHGSDGR